MKLSFEKILPFILIFVGIIFRFLPHAPNFAPIGGLAVFSGIYLSRKNAYLIPIGAMLVSDIFIGLYSIPVMASVYFSFILAATLGRIMKKAGKIPGIFFASIVSAVTFFIITNFAVWLFTPWYPAGISGLIGCFYAATPFFRNTLMSDIFYSMVFSGMYEICKITAFTYFPAKKIAENG